ncbi:MAG: DUF2953 domain-containing protein [Eubacterium sp.]|nr:DUF2953 domain-containing protein [Eubacterium sp.]
MKIFLIVVAVLALIIIAVCSLSATITLVYDKGWSTRVKVLFFEKDIVLSELLSFVMFPQKKAQEVSDKKKAEKAEKASEKQKIKNEPPKSSEKAPQETISESVQDKTEKPAAKAEEKKETPKKSNPIKKLWDDEGIVGILSLVSNLLETANSAILTLIRGLHIYSLYVMIIVGGGDAADIAQSYGTLCKYYYPVKGMILSGMKVDNYDDYIQPDFIAPSTEFEFQLIASINVGLLLKVAFKAGFIFLKNLIKNKKVK